jgi:hypothetical protein
MLKEFKEFALRGNLIDLAIGFIIGAAFTGLVQSLVNDIVMPIIGLVTGGFDFSTLYIQLAGPPAATLAEARKAGATPVAANHHPGDQLRDRRLGAVLVVKAINPSAPTTGCACHPGAPADGAAARGACIRSRRA